jgi:hypothetical protein
MKRKSMVNKPQQNNGVMRDIERAHACIDRDHDQLDKLYKKGLVGTDKNVLANKKLLAKAMVQAKKAKRHKKESPQVYQKVLAEINALQKQADTLKMELACITACYMRFNAKKKVIAKFEKEWSNKKASRPKKRKAKAAGKRIEADQNREVMPG